MRAKSRLLFFLATLAASASVAALDYTVEVDDAARQLSVRAEFGSPIYVGLGSTRAARHVRELRRCETGESLSLRHGWLQTPASCIEYSLTLSNRANTARLRERYAAVRDVVMPPGHWLMLPDDRNTSIDVVFVLPPGVNVSVPWQPSHETPFADVRRLSDAAGQTATSARREAYSFRNRQISSSAITVFGNFEKHRLDVPGGELRVALLRTRHSTEAQTMRRWLTDAAINVSHAHGTFPLQSTQVVVVPVNDRASEPVPFGHVIRSGGDAVQFFVDTDWALDSFLGDWTATHEFSHLLMPYVRDRWVSEGFASYYQNVLMARGGAYDAQTAWRKLYEGYGRGRRSAPEMSPRRATMRNGGLMKMYWSGAAIALMGDVQLRELSNNRESLDTALSRIRRCCLPSQRAYSDLEFFKLLDSKTGYDVFEKLYRDYAHTAGFPDVAGLFERLGVRTSGQLRLVDAELSDIRDAIMRPRSSFVSTDAIAGSVDAN